MVMTVGRTIPCWYMRFVLPEANLGKHRCGQVILSLGPAFNVICVLLLILYIYGVAAMRKPRRFAQPLVLAAAGCCWQCTVNGAIMTRCLWAPFTRRVLR